MDALNLLQGKIRKPIESDKALPEFSYSKLDTYKHCPYQYQIKYIDGKYSHDTTLPLELGSLCHYVLEQKGKMLRDSDRVDYDSLYDILQNGTTQTDEKTRKALLGTTQLKKKYYDTWYVPDNASGKTYEDKLAIFKDVVKTEMENSEWTPVYFEYPFKFVYDNRIIISGFIDRIDVNNKGEYRTIDYKTSKKVYNKSELPTSMQFGIYALAILSEFNTLPVKSVYRFILIDDVQQALTDGWESRLTKALDSLLDSIDRDTAKDVFAPKPTPLCYWCNYCAKNPLAREYKHDCPYYSLWTPTRKTFEVNSKWNANKPIAAKKRKLIF